MKKFIDEKSTGEWGTEQLKEWATAEENETPRRAVLTDAG